MYDAITALHRENKMSTRVRLFFLSMDTRPDVPMLKQRLFNTFNGFGDDMLRVSGIGEFATSWPLFGQPAPTNYDAALQMIARQGWAFQQHSLSPAEDKLTIGAFETVNQTTPIAGLRWSIAHAPRIDVPTINRFKAVGAGDRRASVRLSRRRPRRRAAAPHDRGQRHQRRRRVGFGADLDAESVADHLLHGDRQEFLGRLINDGQQLTRMEALRLYTAENGWFFREEDKLGTIQPGKLGDVVVLSDDYFDPKVPDEAIKRLKSVLTIVDGKVVHDEMP